MYFAYCYVSLSCLRHAYVWVQWTFFFYSSPFHLVLCAAHSHSVSTHTHIYKGFTTGLRTILCHSIRVYNTLNVCALVHFTANTLTGCTQHTSLRSTYSVTEWIRKSQELRSVDCSILSKNHSILGSFVLVFFIHLLKSDQRTTYWSNLFILSLRRAEKRFFLVKNQIKVNQKNILRKFLIFLNRIK